MSTRKVRWGVLSTALIGVEKFIPGLQTSERSLLVAIASRDAARAKQATAGLTGVRAYGSYDELLADPEIEAIYNPLPNNLHVDWTLKAVAAGKHVLCEKPLGLTADDVRRLRVAAKDKLIMEAFMVRFHPQWIRALDLVRTGRIGRVRAVHVNFCYDLKDPDNIRNRLETGGGGLFDIGCYGIVAGREVFYGEPKRVVTLLERDAKLGTDVLSSFMADFGDARHLLVTVGTQLAGSQRVTLLAESGRIEILVPFNPSPLEPTRIIIDDGSALGGASSLTETFDPVDQYSREADAFSRAILGEAPLPYGLDDALANMRALDALFASAASGAWVSVPPADANS